MRLDWPSDLPHLACHSDYCALARSSTLSAWPRSVLWHTATIRRHLSTSFCINIEIKKLIRQQHTVVLLSLWTNRRQHCNIVQYARLFVSNTLSCCWVYELVVTNTLSWVYGLIVSYTRSYCRHSLSIESEVLLSRCVCIQVYNFQACIYKLKHLFDVFFNVCEREWYLSEDNAPYSRGSNRSDNIGSTNQRISLLKSCSNLLTYDFYIDTQRDQNISTMYFDLKLIYKSTRHCWSAVLQVYTVNKSTKCLQSMFLSTSNCPLSVSTSALEASNDISRKWFEMWPQ